MAVIENLADHDRFAAGVEEMDGPALIAQHLVLRGAEHALHSAIYLVPIGAARNVLAEMLENVRHSKRVVEVKATLSKVALVSESE